MPPPPLGHVGSWEGTVTSQRTIMCVRSRLGTQHDTVKGVRRYCGLCSRLALGGGSLGGVGGSTPGVLMRRTVFCPLCANYSAASGNAAVCVNIFTSLLLSTKAHTCVRPSQHTCGPFFHFATSFSARPKSLARPRAIRAAAGSQRSHHVSKSPSATSARWLP